MNHPGVLQFKDGKVSLTLGKGEQFCVPIQEVKNTQWIWFQQSYFFNITVNAKKWKLRFIVPTRSESYGDVSGTVQEPGNCLFMKDMFGEDWQKIVYPQDNDYKALVAKWKNILGGKTVWFW
jgi:hypothetical protein